MKLSHWFAFARNHFSSAPRAMFVVAAAIALSMAAICATTLYQSRLDTMKHAEQTSRNVGLLAANDVARNIELYSLSLQAVIDGLNDPEVMAASSHLRRAVLFDKAATATYLGSTLVLDTNGNIAMDARQAKPERLNFSGYDFFHGTQGKPKDRTLYWRSLLVTAT